MNSYRLLFQAVMAVVLIMLARGCKWGSYDDCQPWPSCPNSCGGGQRCRICESCFWRIDKEVCESCNNFCYNGGEFLNGRCVCPAWRTGSCCQTCINVTMQNGLPGKQVCGGSPDSIKCTQCQPGYTPGDFGEGCLGSAVRTTLRPLPETGIANNNTEDESFNPWDVAGPVIMIVILSLVGTFLLAAAIFFFYKRCG